MEKIRFLVISPYKGLDETIKELLADRDDVSVDCYISNLGDAENLISTLDMYAYDAVISRGGTASLISEKTSLPVYDVGLSALDALRAIRLAENFDQNIAIIGFENITRTMHILNEVMQWTYPIITINEEAEALPRLLELKEQGISIVICDVISSMIAPTIGITPVLVTSGYETVDAALSQAIRLTRGYNSSRQELTHLMLAYEQSPYSCTIIDSHNEVVLTALSKHEANILNFIKEHINEIRQEDQPEFMFPYHGGVLTFYQKARILQGEQYLYLYVRFHDRLETRKIDAIKMRAPSNDRKTELSVFYSMNAQTNVQTQIEKFGRSLSPLIITGEDGTGKDQAAYALHCCSEYQRYVFVQIDCESATDKNWNYLLTNHDSPFMHNKQTLYFRHVDQLPYTVLRKLLFFIMDSNLSKRNRLVFSLAIKPENQHTHEYMALLLKIQNSLTFNMPALRERPDDIPMLCTKYINNKNAEMGKQIIGFDASAMRAMKNFMWEGNMDQLQRVINELMLVTNTSYISFENTMRQLSQESALWSSNSKFGYQFNLNQSLDDINYDIIRQILKEEDDNQSRTAERLGISRSTLWRILKSHN